MNQEINPVEFGIEPVKAKEMLSGLSVIIEEREALKLSYIDVINLPITEENIIIFKELRVKVRDNRTKGIEPWHKTNKAFYLAGGRFVDAIKNKEVLENEQMEAKLFEVEKFFENQEKERLSLLKTEREAFLRPFVESLPNGLEDLDQDVFDSFLETKKKAHLEKLELERLETERIENERLEREKEIEAQRVENERLKVEAEAKEAQLQKERLEAEAKQKAIQDEANRLAKIEADKQAKIQAEKDAEIKKEREAREKLEAEARAERLAKEKAEADELLAAEKLAKAPIKKQLTAWIDSFEMTIPEHLRDNTEANDILSKFWSFKKWAKSEIDKQ